MKFNKGFSSIAIIVVILILLAAGGGVYYWQKLQPRVYEPPAPSGVEGPTQVDPTADWKTYRNEQYGFEFKYPSGWGEIIFEEKLRKGEDESLYDGKVIDGAFTGARLDPNVFDMKISFSKNPFGPNSIPKNGYPKILFVRLSPPPSKNSNRVFYIYTGDEEGNKLEDLSVAEDKKKIERLVNGPMSNLTHPAEIFSNSFGTKIFYAPAYDKEDTILLQLEKFYSPKLGVEGLLDYVLSVDTPQGKEFYDKYYCLNFPRESRQLTFREGCGPSLWLKEGRTATSVRQVFSDFHQILSTFRFVK